MRLYQDGDEMAFEILYIRHSTKINSFLIKKVGDGALASDLLQETFYKLHQSRNTYNSNFPFLPWIFTITKNVLFDNLRKVKKRVQAIPLNEEILNQSTEQIEEEKIEILESALNSLTENQKKALTLRYLDDWSFEAIAQTLNTSTSNSRKLVSRGVMSLKEIFSKKGESSQ